VTVALGALAATEKDGALLVDIVVQPRASRAGVGPVQGDRLRVAVTAPPVDGKANEAVIAALAAALDLPRRSITIVRGETGRRKTVRLDGLGRADLAARLAAGGGGPGR
jgi:uncharacterized protein (TIGR00251 family)